ncbi:hypothetical protein [Streptomyces noursei]|uniref:hypothetical protein n=1 Tax=Streptomyces noursei TaxID=1971 RepID=UPI00045EF589|nr:hypothetical protein [Streptomyces noursei]AIA08613.1 hypothetical protein DC74_p00030 [Streptomyces noursei]
MMVLAWWAVSLLALVGLTAVSPRCVGPALRCTVVLLPVAVVLALVCAALRSA